MKPDERMRYYPAVGPAIPHLKVGRSRVTHPFAGDPLLGPLDLHVLSTPPAFVLSQDQTLQKFEMTLNSINHVAVASESLVCTSDFILSPKPVRTSDRRVRLAHP